jgi:hypothetical protein
VPAATFAAFVECLGFGCAGDNAAPVCGYVDCTDRCVGVAGIADLLFDP